MCMDHDENRARLLEDGVLTSIVAILGGYANKVTFKSQSPPLPLDYDHLKTIRTAIGVLLNASIGFGMWIAP